MRVILDTNVYVSAFRFNKKLLELMERCLLDSNIELIASTAIFSELITVLAKKFGQSEVEIARVKQLFRRVSLVEPRQSLRVVRDPEDDKFIEAAVSAKAHYIISGDNDLLAIKFYGDTKIITPAELMKKLNM